MTIHKPLYCPACGQPMADGRTPLTGLAAADLSALRRKLVDLLAKAYPDPISGPDLIEAIYGDDPDSGPEFAESALGDAIRRTRRLIEPFGWTIPRAKPHAGYRLKPVEVKR